MTELTLPQARERLLARHKFELDSFDRIIRLVTSQAGLFDEGGGVDAVEASAAVILPGAAGGGAQGTERTTKCTKPQKERSTRKGKSVIATPEQLERIRFVGRVAEPFTTHDLLKSKLWQTLGGCSSWMMRAKAEGWVVKRGYKDWTRTAKYPGATGAAPAAVEPAAPVETKAVSKKTAPRPPEDAPAVVIPGLDQPSTTTERLEKALDDLKKAKAAGQETLAQILTAKVAKLTREMKT